jgi:DNA repair exonuclease SbcCD ATPase subunit
MAQIESVFWNLGIKDKKLPEQTIAYIKKTSQIKKASHNQKLRLLKKEHTEIQSKLDRLVDLRRDGERGREDFEGHKSRLKDRQHEIDQLTSIYDKADSFTKTLTDLLTLASEAEPIMWKGSTIAQKRELLNFVFANLKLEGSTLCYILRKPFRQRPRIAVYRSLY